MNQGLRILLAVIVNGITVYGVFYAHWTVATAIALYWTENVIGIVLIAALFVIHRAATHKRGHNRGVLRGFLQATIIFTAGHGIFLGLFIFLIFPRIAAEEVFDPRRFLQGLMMIGGTMLLGFLIAVARVKSTPFAEIRARADSFMPRILVVHLTIIFGMMAMGSVGRPRAFFAVFAVLKLGGDLLTSAPQQTYPQNPPRWLAWLARRTKDSRWLSTWKRDRETALARMAEDEMVQA